MGFPEQLKMARLNMNYTQQQVADLMGIAKSTYCGYETGKRQPDVEKIKLLARILKTSGDTLLETGFTPETEDPKADLENKYERALTLFKSLRPEFQDYALDQMNKLAELQDKN